MSAASRRPVPLSEKMRLAAIATIIEHVDERCMAADGPVTPTRHEMTDGELRLIYKHAKGPATGANPVAERGALDEPDGEAAWLRGLTLIAEDAEIRVASMSYVKPSEYQAQVNAFLDRLSRRAPSGEPEGSK